MPKKSINPSFEEKIFAAISYIWMMSLVPLLMYHNHEYVGFHARQGFILFALESISTLLLPIPVFGWILGISGWVMAIIFSIRGIISALNGDKWVMPYFSGHAKRFRIY